MAERFSAASASLTILAKSDADMSRQMLQNGTPTDEMRAIMKTNWQKAYDLLETEYASLTKARDEYKKAKEAFDAQV